MSSLSNQRASSMADNKENKEKNDNEQLSAALLEAFPTREAWDKHKERFFMDIRRKDRFLADVRMHEKFFKRSQISGSLTGIISGCFEARITNDDKQQEWSALVLQIAKSILVSWQSMRHISGAVLPGDMDFDFRLLMDILHPALLRPTAALALLAAAQNAGEDTIFLMDI